MPDKPAEGYYEWEKTEYGRWLLSCTILTTTAHVTHHWATPR
ncbi:SOS response-associated peptidase [Arthrobacter sp. ISL-65]|nr:SOS response-associated peptidase [Arthrobacter sp. ISL-65]